MLTRVVLIVVMPATGPRTVLLVNEKRPALPSVIVPPWERPGAVASRLLEQVIGGRLPGQRMWLLGHWKPHAVYLAELPELVEPAFRLFCYPAELCELRLPAQEWGWVRRALTWLSDGGSGCSRAGRLPPSLRR